MNRDTTRKYKRDTAVKLHIRNVLSGEYVKEEEETYLVTEFGFHVSRVRVFGTVVDRWIPPTKEEGDGAAGRGPPASITVDDGTETIRVKTWKDERFKESNQFEELAALGLGNLVDIIGRIRKYEEEIYIRPEIIRKIEDPNWELVRELEIIEFLERMQSNTMREARDPTGAAEQSSATGKVGDDRDMKSLFKEKIEEIIKQTSDSLGISKEDLKEQSGIPEEDFEEALNELTNEGTIYQPHKGRYKIL